MYIYWKQLKHSKVLSLGGFSKHKYMGTPCLLFFIKSDQLNILLQNWSISPIRIFFLRLFKTSIWTKTTILTLGCVNIYRKITFPFSNFYLYARNHVYVAIAFHKRDVQYAIFSNMLLTNLCGHINQFLNNYTYY